MHHIALHVRDVKEAIDWYTEHLNCHVRYQDETWGLVEFANISVAFVSHGQHPPHIGFFKPNVERFGPVKPHRDGTRSVYVTDPSGNSVEFLAAD